MEIIKTCLPKTEKKMTKVCYLGFKIIQTGMFFKYDFALFVFGNKNIFE